MGGSRITSAAAVVIALAMAMAGCGGGEVITIDGVWARTSPAMTTAGAVYMNITSDTADRLIGASVDPSVAAKAEIHETVMSDMADEADTGTATMQMQPVDAIDLPGDTTISLEPGGYHIMLLDLARPLVTGETFDLTLGFAEAGDRVVTVEVRDDAP